MNLHKSFSIFCLSLTFMSSAFAIDSGIRGQITRSRNFINFKNERMNLYRTQGNQQGKNAHETCIANEHSKIQTDPPPPFYPYFGLRMTEYRITGSRYAINELEACVEHDYFKHQCEQHHDNSLICAGNVYAPTPIGEGETLREDRYINDTDDMKRIIDSAVEEAVHGHVESQ